MNSNWKETSVWETVTSAVKYRQNIVSGDCRAFDVEYDRRDKELLGVSGALKVNHVHILFDQLTLIERRKKIK